MPAPGASVGCAGSPPSAASTQTSGSTTSSCSPPRRSAGETVTYVSNIYKYYLAYQMIEEERADREKAKAAAKGAPASNAMTIIRAGTLIDGTGAPPVRDALVTIEGGRIEAVTTGGSSGSRPAAGEVIDATGLTVLPGLIDCHDHLAFHGYDLGRRWGLDEPRSTANLRTSAVARRALESGYTAVRDAGGLDAGFRVAIERRADRGPAPRPVARDHLAHRRSRRPGEPVGSRGAGQRRSEPSPSVADGIDAIRTTVRTMVRAGADQIKCATTGGASSRAGHGPRDSESHARGDEGAGRRGARARAAGHVSRARRAGAPRGDRGGRRLDRARLLSGRGSASSSR